MLLNEDQVLAFLPHRKPFLFVDTIKELNTPEGFEYKNDLKYKDLISSTVISKFKVTDDMEILKGHFPGEPILPGVIQSEMMAQTSAFIFLALVNFDPFKYDIDTKLIGVDRTKYRKQVLPGMELETHSTLTKVRGEFNYFDCKIYCNDELCSEGNIFAKIIINKKE